MIATPCISSDACIILFIPSEVDAGPVSLELSHMRVLEKQMVFVIDIENNLGSV